MPDGNEIINAIRLVCDEKNISIDSVIATIEAALAAAYRKDFGEKNQNVIVNFDPENGSSKIYDVKTVVPDVDLEALELQLEAQKVRRDAGEEIPPEEEIKRFNPRTEIMLSEAKKVKKTLAVGGEIKTRLSVPADYGRMAAQTAKQVIIQRLREAERETVYNEFKNRQGEVVTAIVQRMEGRNVLLDIGQATAIMPWEHQVRREHYDSGRRFKVVIAAVEMTSKGPHIVVSRSSELLVSQLFSHEVPEIASGIVVIKVIAREAGERTKLAVASTEDNIDPVGSCVGQRGTRVQTVIQELNGEKIDIVQWEENIEEFIVNAIAPAKVMKVELDVPAGRAVVRVREDQLSLAIGRGGQNVRLASRLVGLKLDIATEDGTVQEVAGETAGETTVAVPTGETAEAPNDASDDKTTPETLPVTKKE